MSKTGKVTSWKGPFGFAETEDGTSVYIHTSEIDGGRLRVGLEVKFDIEEGKEGKMKGTNVSGEAVTAKGAVLTDDQIEDDKKRKNDLKEKAIEKNKEEFEPVWEKVTAMSKTNQVYMLKKLLETEKVGEIVKKRPDPSSKDKTQTYSQGEFVAFYGQKQGLEMWKDAGNKKKSSRTKKITRE